ncbi:MAG: hypothetical protein CMG01_03520 [Candidatus Marinimicrobia bacterium]|nr:hypothetical protein [Candidatus Neomarinimicrobiota bacterium]|tara:strand:- start:1331 stop:1819 length:489 start_codon:yes stop_codon:yes gene_type:complete
MKLKNNTNLISIISIIVLGIIVIGGVMQHEKPSFQRPNTLEQNIVWLDLNSDMLDLWIQSSDDIYGIQFEFEGIKLIDIDGGYLELQGFNTSHNDKMILAFSFEGKHIPKGEHLLCSIKIENINKNNEPKISNMVLAGKGGSALDFGYFDFNKNQTTLRSTY